MRKFIAALLLTGLVWPFGLSRNPPPRHWRLSRMNNRRSSIVLPILWFGSTSRARYTISRASAGMATPRAALTSASVKPIVREIVPPGTGNNPGQHSPSVAVHAIHRHRYHLRSCSHSLGVPEKRDLARAFGLIQLPLQHPCCHE